MLPNIKDDGFLYALVLKIFRKKTQKNLNWEGLYYKLFNLSLKLFIKQVLEDSFLIIGECE